jgi:hypothetical protein
MLAGWGVVWDHGSVDENPHLLRARRSRNELRDLLLASGKAILEEEGLSVGAGDLTFKRVFDHLEAAHGIRLTNASVIRRVWENQDDFRADVLIAVAATADSSGELDRTLEVLAPLMASSDLSSPEARLQSMRDVARVGGEVSIRARIETREWSLWMGVWVLAVTTTLTGRRRDIRGSLTDALEEVTDLWEEVFRGMCDLLGLRVREPLTIRQFTVAVSALVEGSALRQGGDPEIAVFDRPTGVGGGVEEWTLCGVGMEALATQFFEIDPHWTGAATTD